MLSKKESLVEFKLSESLAFFVFRDLEKVIMVKMQVPY